VSTTDCLTGQGFQISFPQSSKAQYYYRWCLFLTELPYPEMLGQFQRTWAWSGMLFWARARRPTFDCWILAPRGGPKPLKPSSVPGPKATAFLHHVPTFFLPKDATHFCSATTWYQSPFLQFQRVGSCWWIREDCLLLCWHSSAPSVGRLCRCNYWWQNCLKLHPTSWPSARR